MTVEGWIIFIIASSVITFLACIVNSVISDHMDSFLHGTLYAAPIIVILLIGMLWWYGNTESGKQAYKTQTSNLNSGIERTVEVYDATGNLIKQYSGKFDVDYKYNRIIFKDVNGKRHTIFYPTGTVIIDETE